MYSIITKKGKERHQLVREGAPVVPEHLRIRSVESLRHHLQTAVELEHSTIPAYLTALYSIKDETNWESAAIIRSVVMEEMLHLILAANVLNAVGGHPSVNHARFVPEYPTYLPHSDKAFLVHLEKLSTSSIGTFLQIEQPKPPHARPEAHDYQTIGQFYEAIALALIDLSRDDDIFTGEVSHQVTPEQYYGGGGEIIVIEGPNRAIKLEKALAALREIVGQGEGVHHSIFDGDHVRFGQEVEPAHYFRFNQIQEGRYYTYTDTPKSGPTGAPLAVDWTAVYNMRTDPKMKDYPEGSELYQKAYQFNLAYTALLDNIHDALNGRPALLLEAVPRMYQLKYLATALMQMPLPGSDETAGPTFELIRKR